MEDKTFFEKYFSDYTTDLFISKDNTMLISLNRAGYDNDLNHYKIGKDFITDKPLPPDKIQYIKKSIRYDKRDERISKSDFFYDKIEKAIDFFNEYATKNKIKTEDIAIFSTYNHPITFICSYYDKNPQRIESKIMFVIANMID